MPTTVLGPMGKGAGGKVNRKVTGLLYFGHLRKRSVMQNVPGRRGMPTFSFDFWSTKKQDRLRQKIAGTVGLERSRWQGHEYQSSLVSPKDR